MPDDEKLAIEIDIGSMKARHLPNAQSQAKEQSVDH